MSDREEWAHQRAELDRVNSLLDRMTAETARLTAAYEKLRNAAGALIALHDEYWGIAELDDKIEQLRKAME